MMTCSVCFSSLEAKSQTDEEAGGEAGGCDLNKGGNLILLTA